MTETTQPKEVKFISSRNERVWAGKRSGLARRAEVFRHIARQAGVPPLPPSRTTPLFRLFATGIGVGAGLVGVVGMGLAIWWLVSAVRNAFWDLDALSMVVMAGIFSLVLLANARNLWGSHDLLVYPPCVKQLYERLLTSGRVTTGRVRDVEIRDDATYRIRYWFTPVEAGERVEGEYVTDRPMRADEDMAVLYLDATCHVLL